MSPFATIVSAAIFFEPGKEFVLVSFISFDFLVDGQSDKQVTFCMLMCMFVYNH